MINLVTKLLAIDIVLELGRVTNLVYGQALKTSGDAVFPLSWVLFSCTLAWSVEHTSSDFIWGFSQSVLISDSQVTSASEPSVWSLRWKSGKWKNKGLVD